jgi:Domain of unknown function (DUF1844)
VKEKSEALFLQLIMQNQQIALMSMGKLKNPVTGKTEKNLKHASAYIDTIEMLAEKTKGNLSAEEDKFISETLKELKHIYTLEIDLENKRTT